MTIDIDEIDYNRTLLERTMKAYQESQVRILELTAMMEAWKREYRQSKERVSK